MEDWKRKRSDDEENNRKCLVFDSQKAVFSERLWGDLSLGDIIKISENEYFPADICLVNTSEPNGTSYVETKNLDGETNLKFKQANPGLAGCFDSIGDFCHLKGVLISKPPNEFIYEFDGKLALEGENIRQKQVFLDKSSFLLRGCSLRQTKFVYGFVVYIGHNTKIMKNSPSARAKISRIENIMNSQILVIFGLQTILSAIGAIFYLAWLNSHFQDLKSYVFVSENSKNSAGGFLFFFYRIGTWTLIFTNLVPISLLVTLEMVKFIQGMFISWDITIYDQGTQTPAKVQTSTLNEELGQVKVN
jgi:phospholipid-transporting ATPase